MKERGEGAGRRGEPTPSQAGRPDQTQTPQQRGEGIRGIPPPHGEQKPQRGDVNKPELHPPKELPLPFEPNLLGHDEHTGDLDPEIGKMIQAAAQGDPEEEKRLRKEFEECWKIPALREFLKNQNRRDFNTLARSAPDVGNVLKKQE